MPCSALVCGEVARRIDELRTQLEASPFYECAHHREYLHEQTLLRFLVAVSAATNPHAHSQTGRQADKHEASGR